MLKGPILGSGFCPQYAHSPKPKSCQLVKLVAVIDWNNLQNSRLMYES